MHWWALTLASAVLVPRTSYLCMALHSMLRADVQSWQQPTAMHTELLTCLLAGGRLGRRTLCMRPRMHAACCSLRRVRSNCAILLGVGGRGAPVQCLATWHSGKCGHGNHGLGSIVCLQCAAATVPPPSFQLLTLCALDSLVRRASSSASAPCSPRCLCGQTVSRDWDDWVRDRGRGWLASPGWQAGPAVLV